MVLSVRRQAAAALAAELVVWGAVAAAATWYAPPFARPSFPGWGIAHLPFDGLGRTGLWLRFVLACLAHRHAR